MSTGTKTNRMTMLAGLLLILFFVGAAGTGYYYSQNASLHSQVSSLNSQISSLQSTISSQNEVLALSNSQPEATQVTINQDAGGTSQVASFTAQYAGQVKISGTSTTTAGYLIVSESNGFKQQYAFGTSNTVYVNIVPGNVTVAFGNTNFGNGATATLTVTYIY